MTSLMGKLTALACHPTKKVNSRVTNLSLYKHWLSPLVNVLKHFFFVTDYEGKKSRAFVFGKLIQPSLIFTCKGGAYPSRASSRCFSLRWITNIRPSCKGFHEQALHLIWPLRQWQKIKINKKLVSSILTFSIFAIAKSEISIFWTSLSETKILQ